MLGEIGDRRRRGRPRMRWPDGITDSIDVSLSELRKMVMDREAWRAVIHGVAKSGTRLSDWTELNWLMTFKSLWFPKAQVYSGLPIVWLINAFLIQQANKHFLSLKVCKFGFCHFQPKWSWLIDEVHMGQKQSSISKQSFYFTSGMPPTPAGIWNLHFLPTHLLNTTRVTILNTSCS